MQLKDLFLVNITLQEKIIIILLVVICIFIFMPDDKSEVVAEPIVSEEFDKYPLVAWKDTHEKWDGKQDDIVKIKYRVFNKDTFIQIINSEGEVVHVQPFQRSPWDDGRYRDFTYTWMLYYTEDYGDDIPPGEYQIQVCHIYSRNVDMILDITI